MLLSVTRCLSKNGVAACAGGRGCGGLFSKRGRLYSRLRKNDTACFRKLFSLRGGLSFPDKWIAGLVRDPSLALLAGDFAIHEGLDDLLASQGAALALACDEDHFIGFVSRFEDLNVLRCLPCTIGSGAGAEERYGEKEQEQERRTVHRLLDRGCSLEIARIIVPLAHGNGDDPGCIGVRRIDEHVRFLGHHDRGYFQQCRLF